MGNIFDRFHTISIMTYLLCFLIFIWLCNNIVFLALGSIAFCCMLSFIDKQNLKKSIYLAFFIAVPILIINILVDGSGRNLIFKVEDVPILNEIRVTQESLIRTIVMIIKLSGAIFVFTFFGRFVNADKLFGFVSTFASKSALATAITSRMMPYLADRTKEIITAQSIRGIEMSKKGLKNKIKNMYPVSKILLFSSLEASWQIAEALESRGYGKEKRTALKRENFGIRDIMLITCSTTMIFIPIAAPVVVLIPLVFDRFEKTPYLASPHD